MGDKSLYFQTKVEGAINTLALVKIKKRMRFGRLNSENLNQIGEFGKCGP